MVVSFGDKVAIFPVMFSSLVISATVINNLVLIGAVMSVLLTTFESYFDYQMDYKKTIALQGGVDSKIKILHQEFKDLINLNEKLSEKGKNQLRLFHLENKRLYVEGLELNAHMKFIKVQQIHSVISQLMFPAIVFGSLFVSAPLAIAIIASSIIIAIITRAMIVHKFKAAPSNNSEIMLTKDEYDNPAMALFHNKNKANSIEQSTVREQNNFSRYGLFSTSAPNISKDNAVVFSPAII